MGLPLDELYFLWLCDQVGTAHHRNDPSTAYYKLLKLLHCKEFVWFIPNDDNRAEDGRDLRKEFSEHEQIQILEPGWMKLSCDMLELLIALSRRLAFEADGEPRAWFWEMINNLGLYEYRDGKRLPLNKIDEILDQVIWRTYEPDGAGGLFPLREAREDQREVELWYQMSAYLLERD